MQAKLENVVDDISRNSLEMMDSKLFVGDKAGLKQMKRRMVSRPDTDLLFMSGLREDQREEDETEEAVSGPSTSKAEVRELRSSDSEEEQVDAALAASLSSEGPSQEQIMNLIKTEMKTDTADNYLDDDEDIVVLLPTTSLFNSNRMGGREFSSTIKEEPEEITLDTEPADLISDSDSESEEDFEEVTSEAVDEEEDDMFADVFNNADDIEKLNSIVGKVSDLSDSERNKDNSQTAASKLIEENDKTAESAVKCVNEEAEQILQRISKLDKPGDILADIVSRANKKQEKSSFTKEVSDNLKNGPGIMMKIASKWADAEVKKASVEIESPEDPDDPPEVTATSLFDKQQEDLVGLMETAEREKRLNRFTAEGNADLTVETVSKKSGAVEAQEAFVVQSDRRDVETAADSDGPEDDEERLDDSQLEALQARLAAEQDSLVAELSKAERLSSSITDQMYAECQQLIQMFGLPWLVAPGEAEAQCAQLDQAGLTQGGSIYCCEMMG